MSNMEYCRFRNTLQDLIDCNDALNELRELDELSEEERRAAIRLVRQCHVIAESFSEWVDEYTANAR